MRRTAFSIARVVKGLSCRSFESVKRISAVRQWNPRGPIHGRAVPAAVQAVTRSFVKGSIMVQTTLPKFNMDTTETGCCPRFDPAPWDEQEFRIEDRLFLLARTWNFLHIPLNMGSMMKKTWAKIQAAEAASQDDFLVLSTDPSPWPVNTISRSRRMFPPRRWFA